MGYVDRMIENNVEYDIRDTSLTLAYLHYFIDGSNVDFFVRPYIINTSNVWARESDTHLLIPVSSVSSVYITASRTTVYCFLTSESVVEGDTPPYATGSSRTTLAENTSTTLTVPSNAQYLYLHYIANSLDYTPATLKLDNVDFFKTVPEILSSLINGAT